MWHSFIFVIMLNISVNNVGMSYDFPEYYAEISDDQVSSPKLTASLF